MSGFKLCFKDSKSGCKGTTYVWQPADHVAINYGLFIEKAICYNSWTEALNYGL